MTTNKTKILFPTSIIIGSIIIAIGIYAGLTTQQSNIVNEVGQPGIKQPIAAAKEPKEPNALLALTEEDHIYGNTDANISLIEYSDFECPFCQKFHTTPEALVDEYDGKVNWVYRHYPLSFHDPAATLEAEASECANEQGGNDTFWKYAELIYEKTAGNGSGIDRTELIAMAESLDLDQGIFKECLDSGKFQDRIKRDFENGSNIGVSGTPATFVVNHKTGEQTLITGAQPLDKVKAAIDQLI